MTTILARIRKLAFLYRPRSCDYCNRWFVSADLWVCAECTEMRTVAWYAADCPPISGATEREVFACPAE